MIADRWAALAKLLAVTDPAEADAAGTRSFLKTLAGRMRRDAARSFRRGLRGDRVTLHGGESSGVGWRVDTVHPDLVDRYPLDDRAAPVEDLALARIELAAIATQLRNGTIPERQWRQLVAHRLSAAGEPGARSTVRRTSRRLAHAIGHAA